MYDVKKSQMSSWFCFDYQFHQLYAEKTREMAERHWTPLHVARKAAKFLAVARDSRILDIGSGCGKFCIAAGWYQPRSVFYGVEQRGELLSQAETVKDFIGVRNVHFIKANVINIDLKTYDHFYFYNSFYENLGNSGAISGGMRHSPEKYDYYQQYILSQFDEMPSGTKIAAFHSLENSMPPGYELTGSYYDQLLNFWQKK